MKPEGPGSEQTEKEACGPGHHSGDALATIEDISETISTLGGTNAKMKYKKM